MTVSSPKCSVVLCVCLASSRSMVHIYIYIYIYIYSAYIYPDGAAARARKRTYVCRLTFHLCGIRPVPNRNLRNTWAWCLTMSHAHLPNKLYTVYRTSHGEDHCVCVGYLSLLQESQSSTEAKRSRFRGSLHHSKTRVEAVHTNGETSTSYYRLLLLVALATDIFPPC